MWCGLTICMATVSYQNTRPMVYRTRNIFAVRGQSPGIKVGTSITLLSKIPTGSSTGKRVLYRDFHQARADERRQALLDSLEAPSIDSDYSTLEPDLQLGLPFKPLAVSENYHDWPALTDLFPVSFPGVKTSRDGFLVDTDLARLKARVGDYFNDSLSHNDIARHYPDVMNTTSAVRRPCSAREPDVAWWPS